MIRYQNFDSDSPYNREAAHWAKVQTDCKFPIDERSIRDLISNPEKVNAPSPAPREAAVTRVSNDVAVAEIAEDAEVIEDGIEIIERGIEIIETNLDRNKSTNDDGIIFLD